MNRLSVKPLVKITAMQVRVRIANIMVRGIMTRNRYQLKPRRELYAPSRCTALQRWAGARLSREKEKNLI
jgi:hypothetical protein